MCQQKKTCSRHLKQMTIYLVGRGYLSDHLCSLGIVLECLSADTWLSRLSATFPSTGDTVLYVSAHVVHDAAPDAHQQTVEAVCRTAELLCTRAVHVVFVSTLGAHPDIRIGQWPYYHSKRTIEHELQRLFVHSGRCTVVRLPMLIGPPVHASDGANRSNRLIRALRDGTVPVDLGGRPAIMDVRDAAQLLMSLVQTETCTAESYRVLTVPGYCVGMQALAQALHGRSLPRIPALVRSLFPWILPGMPGVPWSRTSMEMAMCDWSVPSVQSVPSVPSVPSADVVPLRPLADTLGLRLPGTTEIIRTQVSPPPGMVPSAHILLTGVTGFVGTMVLASLLSQCPTTQIHVLVRDKRGVNAGARFAAQWDASAPLRALAHARARVHVVEGDCSQPLLGMSSSVVDQLRHELDCVIHCAASVRFDHPLSRACLENVYPVTQLLRLFADRASDLRVIHVSTAYVDYRMGHLSGQWRPLEHVRDIDALYRSATCAQWVPELTPFPNTYTFTKALAEELLLRSALTVHVVRPAIVHASIAFPFPGYSAGYGAAIGVFMGHLQSGCVPLPLPCDNLRDVAAVPVDVCADHIVSVAFDTSAPRIQTLSATPSLGSIPSMATTHVMMPYLMARQWVTVPRLLPDAKTYALGCLQLSCRVVEHVGGGRRRVVEQLRTGITALVAFVYTPRTFASVSPSVAQCYDGQTARYHMLSSLIGCTERMHASPYVDALRETTMWMSPWYPLLVCLFAWCAWSGSVCGLLCLVYVWHCIVPVHDFQGTMLPWVALPTALWLRQSIDRLWVVPRDWLATMHAHRHANQLTVLCCSHTSYLDCIVVPFVLYMLSPLLDIERPRIVACRSFARIPVIGTLMRWCGAVFVTRRNHAVGEHDRQSLSDELLQCILEDRGTDTRGPCFLVFPSGTRSRDGVSQSPMRTGFFKALWQAATAAGVAEIHLVPIGVTYDRRVDDTMLFGERDTSSATIVAPSRLGAWWTLLRSIMAPPRLGNIVVRAGTPSIHMLGCGLGGGLVDGIVGGLGARIRAQMDIPASIWQQDPEPTGPCSRRRAPAASIRNRPDRWSAVRMQCWQQYIVE